MNIKKLTKMGLLSFVFVSCYLIGHDSFAAKSAMPSTCLAGDWVNGPQCIDDTWLDKPMCEVEFGEGFKCQVVTGSMPEWHCMCVHPDGRMGVPNSQS